MSANSQQREERFQDLLDNYAPALRRLCAAHRREAQDQQDLFQEIAVALWTALPNFRGDSSERTWLYRIAHNVAYTDAARRERGQSKEAPIEEAPPQTTTDQEQRANLLDAVRRLASMEQQLALLYLEGLTTKEIAEVLGIAEGNAAVRLTRLRQRLTEILKPKETQHERSR